MKQWLMLSFWYCHGKCCGYLSFFFDVGDGFIPFRKFAVLQRQEMGTLLVQEVLRKLQKDGISLVFIDTRVNAILRLKYIFFSVVLTIDNILI